MHVPATRRLTGAIPPVLHHNGNTKLFYSNLLQEREMNARYNFKKDIML